MKSRWFIAITFALLCACNQKLPGSKSIRIVGVNNISDQDRLVIQKRLSEGNTSETASYQFHQLEGNVTIEAKLAVDNSDIQYLLGHQGNFRVASAGGLPWFNQKDILQTSVGFDEQQKTLLKLTLTDAAAKRVARLTDTPEDMTVLIMLDGETLSTARLTSPILDGAMQITLDRTPHEAMLIAKLIGSGPLSFQAKDLQIK